MYTTRYGAELPNPHNLAPTTQLSMTMPRLSSARIRKWLTKPSVPTAAPTRRRGERLHISSSLSSKILECGNSETRRRFTPTSHQMGIFKNLQVMYTGCHVLDLLVLNNEMQRYHLEVEGIPEYINMLKDARKQAGRAGRKIADKTLLIFASTAMLTNEQYKRTNHNWEDISEDQKTWATGITVTRRRTLRRAPKHKPPKGLTILALQMRTSGSSKKSK